MSMQKAISPDGTVIAYEKEGDGPPLILVDGAMTTRGSKAPLAAALAPHFRVCRYDRRGRGDSGDTPPYAVERELEDIAELIDRAGGEAFLYGHSSGGCLALEAAAAFGGKVTGVAVYEAPYDDDPADRPRWAEYLRQLAGALGGGRRGDAIALFMRYIGTPDEQIAGMRQAPFWVGLEAVAPTLAYDHAGLLGPDRAVPVRRLATVTVAALAVCGSSSPRFMQATAETISQAVPHGAFRLLDGQDHQVAAEALAPVLTQFFAA